MIKFTILKNHDELFLANLVTLNLGTVALFDRFLNADPLFTTKT
jgi:hypothetical protein